MEMKMTDMMKPFFHRIGEKVRLILRARYRICIFLTLVLHYSAGQILDDQLHDMLVKRIPAGAKLTALMARNSHRKASFACSAD